MAVYFSVITLLPHRYGFTLITYYFKRLFIKTCAVNKNSLSLQENLTATSMVKAENKFFQLCFSR